MKNQNGGKENSSTRDFVVAYRFEKWGEDCENMQESVEKLGTIMCQEHFIPYKRKGYHKLSWVVRTDQSAESIFSRLGWEMGKANELWVMEIGECAYSLDGERRILPPDQVLMFFRN